MKYLHAQLLKSSVSRLLISYVVPIKQQVSQTFLTFVKTRLQHIKHDSMNWYNIFSKFYDTSIEGIYKTIRQQAFQKLKQENTSLVLDLACGTGLNFPPLKDCLGNETTILGLDMSSGMLERAQKRIIKNNFKNIFLLEADASTISQAQINEALGSPRELDCIVSSLALVVLPEWEAVFAKLFDLLRPGGQFLMMEVWAERRVPQTYWTEMIARADLRRKVWEPLEVISENYEFEFIKGSPHIHGGRLFVATGFKGE